MEDFRFSEDIELVKELLNMSYRDLAERIGVDPVTISRWKGGDYAPSSASQMAFYDFAFREGVRLNDIKAQLHKEQLGAAGLIPLFHGAKREIAGPLSLAHSRPANDFGCGFYCGESLEQSAMFVSGYPASSVYIFSFNPAGLSSRTYRVDRDWMLSIGWFRGKLSAYAEHEKIAALREQLDGIDYLVAPIADNRMFEILNQFMDGEITDVQCQHCLSATNLGNQYVLLTERALAQTSCVERCFLSDEEKSAYVRERQRGASVGADKVRIARRQFRGQGLYIDEVLS